MTRHVLAGLAVVALAACGAPAGGSPGEAPAAPQGAARATESRWIGSAAAGSAAETTHGAEPVPMGAPPAGEARGGDFPAPLAPAEAPLPPLKPQHAPEAAPHTAADRAEAAPHAEGVAALPAPPRHEIVMKDLRFEPVVVAVPVGATVVWRNLDRVQHQVRGGESDSGRIHRGGYWASVMNRPGHHRFQCDLHPTMLVEVVVEPDHTRPQHFGT